MAGTGGFVHHLISATIFAAAACACFITFVLLPPGQQLDAEALGATLLDMPIEVQLQVYGSLRAWSIVVLGGITVILSCAALLRGQERLVVLTFFSCLGAAGGAVLLSLALWRPDLGVQSYAYNTWPSGHVASVCVLALASLRLLPKRTPWRPTYSLLAVVAVTVAGYASTASFAHRPSDSVGAVLLCGAVFALTREAAPQHYRRCWSTMLVLPVAAASAVLLVSPAALAPEDPESALALAWLLAMFGAACWVLVPEGVVGYDRRPQRRRTASS